MSVTAAGSDDDYTPMLAGDKADDDGQVLNSLVEQHAEPPTPAELPKGPTQRLDGIPIPNRLLSGTVLTSPSWVEPTLVLPADPLRTHLTLRVISATLTDTIVIADDGGKVQLNSGQTASGGLTLAVGQVVVLDGFTGPVWVKGTPTNTGPAYLTYGAVTK